MIDSPSEFHSPTWDVLAVTQGVFYIGTGVWPIVHLRSFEWVTGPKAEGWLVKTVGVVITVIGAVMIDAARRRSVDTTVARLGAGTALALAAVDVVYASKRRISPVYLLDAVCELALAGAWLAPAIGARARAR